jgi:hypothetical protein
MRYPRKLPAGDVHRPEELGGLRGHIFGRQIPPTAALYCTARRKVGPPVKAAGPYWSLALLNRNGRRRRAVHTAPTRLSPGPQRPAQARAGSGPLFAIGEAVGAGLSPAVHVALMVASACQATVGPRRRGVSRGPAVAAWRRVGPRAGPAGCSLTAPASRRSATGAVCCPCPWARDLPCAGATGLKDLIPAGRRGEKRND